MPADLPGFYYDVTRNRYFPLASRQPSSPSTFSSNTKVSRDDDRTKGAVCNNNGTKSTTGAIQLKQRGNTLRWSLVAGSSLSITSKQEILHNALLRSLERPLPLHSSSKAPFDYHGVDLTCLAIDPHINKDTLINEHGQVHLDATGDGSYLLAGDKVGMLYTASRREPEHPWSPLYHMRSQISSVHIHNDTMFAASFGPNPQLFIAKQEYMSSLNMHAFHDLWSVYWITGLLPESTAHDPAEVVGGASAVIGMKQRAAYMPSLETHRGSYLMPTGSDIFSVYKYHSAVLTGARNGSIKLFDIRAPPSSHVTLFPPCVKSTPQRGWDSRGKQTNARSRVNASTSSNSHSETKTRHTSSVTNLHVIDDWGLLVSSMDGTLAVYDMRFCSPTSSHRSPQSSNTAANRELFRTHPDAGRNDSRSYINRGGPDSVVAFAGHVNSCSQGLGFYVAPSPGVVFAAGEDRKVRAWSLRTGEPIQPRAENNKGLLSHTFDRPVNAIVPAQEGQEIWVASGRDVFCFQSPVPI